MSNDTTASLGQPVTRRQALARVAKTTAAATTITGFPLVWAQNIKDVKLLQIGGSYSNMAEIANQASKDLGFQVSMQATDDNTQINRTLTQPSSFDINDINVFYLEYFLGRKVLQPVPVAKYKHWEKTVPLFTKGQYPDGKRASMQGIAPIKVQYYESREAAKFSATPTEWLTGVPSVYNADTLGVRQDLVGRKIEQWKDLLSPEFKGRAALIDIPSVGIMDVAMALESRGDIVYGDKGNMTRAEIDKTIAIMLELKRSGHFRAFWSNFDQSVNLMASGEVVIQSMWSPAVTVVRSRGVQCNYVPLREGYRGWGSVLAPMAHLSGLKLDAAIEYLNWYNSGWVGAFIAKSGYYSSVPSTAKKHLSADEWGYWYEGKVAASEIKDAFGNAVARKGEVRDGGAFWDRMGKIACWNSRMSEDRYLTKRWNEFVSS